MVAAAVEVLTLEVVVVCNNKALDVERNLRAGVDKILLQLGAGLGTDILILLGCNDVDKLIGVRTRGIRRSLREVTALPQQDAAALLPTVGMDETPEDPPYGDGE